MDSNARNGGCKQRKARHQGRALAIGGERLLLLFVRLLVGRLHIALILLRGRRSGGLLLGGALKQ
jgi:hypothetical protein